MYGQNRFFTKRSTYVILAVSIFSYIYIKCLVVSVYFLTIQLRCTSEKREWEKRKINLLMEIKQVY